MDAIRSVISTAPEIFLLLSIALGTFFGRLQIKGFSVGATACTLIVAVMLGQLGNFMIPPLFKSIFFSLFVFTIGYKSGPEFFASLSIRTLSQVGVAMVVAFTGLAIVLAFAFAFHLDSGTAAGLAAGSLTQSSVIGTFAPPTSSTPPLTVHVPEYVAEFAAHHVGGQLSVAPEHTSEAVPGEEPVVPMNDSAKKSPGHDWPWATRDNKHLFNNHLPVVRLTERRNSLRGLAPQSTVGAGDEPFTQKVLKTLLDTLSHQVALAH